MSTLKIAIQKSGRLNEDSLKILKDCGIDIEELKSITCPVLVVAGEKDVIKEGHTRSIASNILNSTLLIASAETHYFPSENPVKFNAAVIDFLKK